MEVDWLCGARTAGFLTLHRQNIPEDGLYIEQSKTGVKQIKEWTPRLRQAIDKALAVESKHPTMFIFHNRSGTKLSAESLRDDWKKAWIAANKDFIGLARFTFHDLKAKGVSDYVGEDKRSFSGHMTEKQVAVYDRKVKVTPSLDPDKDS